MSDKHHERQEKLLRRVADARIQDAMDSLADAIARKSFADMDRWELAELSRLSRRLAARLNTEAMRLRSQEKKGPSK